MNVDVETRIVIDSARAAVSGFAGDPDNAPRWYENIESVAWQGTRSVAVGARVAFVARFLGRKLSYTYEIVELVAGERLVMRTAQGPFPMETSYAWRDAGNGATEMTLRNRGEPTGFSRLLAPLIAGAMRRANRKDLERLKELLEAGVTAENTGVPR